MLDDANYNAQAAAQIRPRRCHSVPQLQSAEHFARAPEAALLDT